MSDTKQDILALTPAELEQWLAEAREPAYRVKQVLDWLYRKWVGSFDEMTNISKALREALKEGFRFPVLDEVQHLSSPDGNTEKLSFELADGECIESVALQDEGRLTFCISSQAGCALGCRFCATGVRGYGRNLTVGEILGQVTALARATGALQNIVFMGMGEPLLNLRAVVAALEALTDDRRLDLGRRRITVSTAGITPGIRALARSGVRPNLALSLNSPFEGQRRQLMPVSSRYPLEEVLQACRDYAEQTRTRLTLEYVLIRDLNTSPEAARTVARLARNLGASVNLIVFNPVPGADFHQPSKNEVKRFRHILEKAGVRVSQRYRRGHDIAAGCGQLAGIVRSRSRRAGSSA